MTRRDEELLAKQLRGTAPLHDGWLAPVVIAVFLVGLMVGGTLFTPPAHSGLTAPNDALAAVTVPDNPAIKIR
jgi:hypothetical protein